MSRDSIRLDIDDRLHGDLLAERIVERGRGNILRRQLNEVVSKVMPHG